MPATKNSQRSNRKRDARTYYEYGGIAQHSLVEHALCPLHVNQSLAEGAVHEYEYFFLDKNRNTKKSSVRIGCPFGLSPNDEFYLWGLLQLTFSQKDGAAEFFATPHYCLRQLGVVTPESDQQKRYVTFRQAIRRLSGVVYQNDRFYDPIRGEHRDVSFGLLKYSLPLDPQSSRAWRFVWDPQFFEFCSVMRGGFQFDLDLYRELDRASRRLLLFLKKIFWRRDSVTLDVVHLATNVLGFARSVSTADLKIKLKRCASKLLDHRLIRLPDNHGTVNTLIFKRHKGKYDITFYRGPYFDEPSQYSRRVSLKEAPCYDPLHAIGFDDFAIGRILNTYKQRLVQEWADITLAAVDQDNVNKDPKAYFRYYIQKAANREATPPDWWRELRKREEQRRWDEQHATCPAISDALSADKSFDEAFADYLDGEARTVFEKLTLELFNEFETERRSGPQAKQLARQFARQHLQNQFLDQHPEFRSAQ